MVQYIPGILLISSFSLKTNLLKMQSRFGDKLLENLSGLSLNGTTVTVVSAKRNSRGRVASPKHPGVRIARRHFW